MAQGVAMDRMFQALAMNVPSFFRVVLNITVFKGDTQQNGHAKK